MSLTSVAAGRPRINPRKKTENVIDPSHDFNPEGLMAMIPWMTEWNRARHWLIPFMIRVR